MQSVRFEELLVGVAMTFMGALLTPNEESGHCYL
jgi:hypothetical protein